MSTEALALSRSPIITFGYLMQVFLSLLLVLAFIYLIAKYILPRLKITPTSRLIKVLDRVYLEPNVSAYVIQVGRSSWLVAASNKHIAKIDKIDGEALAG